MSSVLSLKCPSCGKEVNPTTMSCKHCLPSVSAEIAAKQMRADDEEIERLLEKVRQFFRKILNRG